MNYVERTSVDNRLITALAGERHIVIHGSSKQGKTSLRKRTLIDSDYLVVTCSNKWQLSQLHSSILKEAGFLIEGTSTKTVGGDTKISAKFKSKFNVFGSGADLEAGTEANLRSQHQRQSTPLELDPTDVNDIIAALKAAEAPKFIVLEDFHYLPEETQKDFAVALKAFHEASKFTFIVIGVWRDENRLLQHNGDLTGRVISINADKWTGDELSDVIKEGEHLLNISFTQAFKSELLSECFNNVSIVQECCLKACENASVYCTKEHLTTVEADASNLIKEVVDSNSSRFLGFIGDFSDGFQTSELEMYKWVLLPIITSNVEELEGGITYKIIRQMINEKHPKAPINPGNITQALQSVASLQVTKNVKPIILDYDATAKRLNVVDRSFLIWLQHQDRDELLEHADF